MFEGLKETDFRKINFLHSLHSSSIMGVNQGWSNGWVFLKTHPPTGFGWVLTGFNGFYWVFLGSFQKVKISQNMRKTLKFILPYP
jgi:hypothetical protein